MCLASDNLPFKEKENCKHCIRVNEVDLFVAFSKLSIESLLDVEFLF